MSKATASDLTDLGFVKEMFRFTADADFVTYIDTILAEVAIDLAGLVGTSTYNSTIEPTQSYVKRAEKCLAASELWQRRANIVLKKPGNLDRQSLAASEEKKQAKDYAKSAEEFINKLTSGDGISASSSITSHFVETS